jgi:hypothetical protein
MLKGDNEKKPYGNAERGLHPMPLSYAVISAGIAEIQVTGMYSSLPSLASGFRQSLPE